MFICEQCGKQTGLHEKMLKKITETRKRCYRNGGVGWEIVKEIAIGTCCFNSGD